MNFRLFKGRENDVMKMTLLRFAVGAVFLWFGVDKWVHPSAWYGWMPSWLTSFLHGGALDSFIYLNGIFEVAVGLAFVANRFVQIAAASAGAFLFLIALTVGANEVTIRDNALLGVCIVLFVNAGEKAKWHLSPRAITTIYSAYIAYLFIYGVLYLRVAP